MEEHSATCTNRRQNAIRRVPVFVLNDKIIRDFDVRERTLFVPTSEGGQTPVLGRRIVKGKPAGTQRHGLDRPIWRILMPALLRSDLGGFHQQIITEYFDVGSQYLFNYADYVLVQAEGAV